LEPFAEHYCVVRYDARGFGDSPLPGGPFSFVEDLCAIFEHLGIQKAALVGNSLGGKTAVEAAIVQPERVGALVLVNSALGGHEASAELADYDAQEDALLDAGKLEEAVELNLRMWLAPDVESTVRTRVRATQRRAFETILAAYERDPPPGPVGWLEDPPAAERLAEIQQPTLVVLGQEDVHDFHVIADRLVAEIPDARMAVIPGAGHVPGIERPEEFNRVVLEFLQLAEWS
jgi:pimeloyl-ACP methyl ester carboxylesterase